MSTEHGDEHHGHHDIHRLHGLGYAHELARIKSGFSQVAVCFTIISVLSGCLTLYGFGLDTGGPAVIGWGWPSVGLMTLFAGAAFEPCPWQLKRWSRLIGTIAVAWVMVITVLLMLPTADTITARTLNYTPIAVLVVLGFAGTWWLASAENWFTGPEVQSTPEEPASAERELESRA